jgi:CheY-like chemotaxis protein
VAKVLLIDDDEAALTWMTAALQSRGHEVMPFTHARLALEALRTATPDLIVSDVMMPEIDGLAFARLVRSHMEIPIMFLSIAKKEAEAVLAGATAYVRKPASAPELRAAVERVLSEGTRRNTILIVDDDPDVRDLYQEFLEPTFDVLTAEHGRDALEQLARTRVDLAIIDVQMPVMNGVELIRAMRADPRWEHLPVIVQTNDRAALAASNWSTLHVSQVMDKMRFVDWFESQVRSLPKPSELDADADR